MRGYPVWLMLVGPPESGKTDLLKHLTVFNGVRECGDLSGKAGLLSATKAKEKAADATGGLLYSLPVYGGLHRGCLLMLDFARTVLAAEPSATRSTLGAIGMLHDQHWQRDVGTDGGRTLSFHGRIGFLAACTDMIDHPDHQQANAEMGERCIFLRYPESDGYHEISRALENPDSADKNTRMNDAFVQFREELGMDWDDAEEPRELTLEEKKMVVSLAQFTARGRSGVQRDRYNRNEITGINRSALGPRIANSFAQLLRGMERIGCTPEDRVAVLRQCTMDSLPSLRAVAVRLLQQYAGPVSLRTLAGAVKVSDGALKRALEDLRMHGLVALNTDALWHLSDVAQTLLAVGGLE